MPLLHPDSSSAFVTCGLRDFYIPRACPPEEEAQQLNEMECLATIAQYVKLGKTLEQAELTKLGEPACKEYLETIAHFARLFAGGDQMPLVEFLSTFSNLLLECVSKKNHVNTG